MGDIVFPCLKFQSPPDANRQFINGCRAYRCPPRRGVDFSCRPLVGRMGRPIYRDDGRTFGRHALHSHHPPIGIYFYPPQKPNFSQHRFMALHHWCSFLHGRESIYSTLYIHNSIAYLLYRRETAQSIQISQAFIQKPSILFCRYLFSFGLRPFLCSMR